MYVHLQWWIVMNDMTSLFTFAFVVFLVDGLDGWVGKAKHGSSTFLPCHSFSITNYSQWRVSYNVRYMRRAEDHTLKGNHSSIHRTSNRLDWTDELCAANDSFEKNVIKAMIYFQNCNWLTTSLIYDMDIFLIRDPLYLLRNIKLGFYLTLSLSMCSSFTQLELESTWLITILTFHYRN